MNEAHSQQILLAGEKEQLRLIARRQLSKIYSGLAGSKMVPSEYLAMTLEVLSTPGKNIYEEILRERIKKAYPKYAQSSGLISDPTSKEMKDKLFLPEEQKLLGAYIDRDRSRFASQFEGVEEDQPIDSEFLQKWVEHRAEVFRRQHLRVLGEEADSIFLEDRDDPKITLFKHKPTWLRNIQEAEKTDKADHRVVETQKNRIAEPESAKAMPEEPKVATATPQA